MPQRVSGKRYAQAVFDLALERDLVDQWHSELGFVEEALQNEDFSAFLKHADVPLGDKVRAIDTVMAEIHPLVQNLVKFLVTKGLVDVVPSLRSAYAGQLDDHHGRQRVEVTSAVPLEPGELERIDRFVSGLIRKEAVISTQVDESILGGIVIQIGDQLLDGSTKSQLDGLRNRMH
jgi:F-type H+-transporting ATPase subunit delta